MSRRFVANARFEVPELPRGVVRRDRLTRALEITAPLTLVVGAPGSGKTVAVVEWLRRRDGAWTWLSCDPTDADPVRFWTALAMAVQRVVPEAGRDALTRLDADGMETADMAASLANDCGLLADLAIVVDDFHLAEPAPDVLAAFVRSLRAGTRLVLASRRDPPFSVSRLRLQRQLTEVRDADLRFTPEEAKALFESLDVAASARDMARLHDATEGWVAGLQLTAMSVRGRADVNSAIDALVASDRALSDFLVDEVLDLEDPETTEFLLATSVLESFDGALCDAVVGRRDSAARLERLQETNRFVVALDRRAGWYRYHHLFASCLRARLRATSENDFVQAHERAARALADRGDLMQSVSHSMSAGDVQTAFHHVRSLAASDQDLGARQLTLDIVRSWLRLHGQAFLSTEAGLVLECCVILVALGALNDADVWLRRLERRVGELARPDAALLRSLRAFYQLQCGDPAACLHGIGTALDLIGDDVDKSFWLSQYPVVAGQAHLLLGDTAGTRQLVDRARGEGHGTAFVDSVRFPGFLAWAALLDGELRTAMREASSAMDAARSADLPEGNLHWVLPRLALAAVHRERDELSAARPLLEVAVRDARNARRGAFTFMCELEAARLAAADGDVEASWASLGRARAVFADPTPAVTDQLAQFEAWLAIGAGDVDAGERVSALRPSIERAFLEARLALAHHDPLAAKRALADIGEGDLPRRTEIERRLLITGVLLASDRRAACDVLIGALELAAEVGLVRAVADHGPAVSALLSSVPADRRVGAFAARVLEVARRRTAPPRFGPVSADGEALSERERVVLRMLSSRLTYTEIAGELAISVNTLKSHIKAVYRKLGASGRSEAVTAARRAGLF